MGMGTNVFGEQQKFHPAAKEVAWPVKLAMKYGAKTERQASAVVIVLSVILIIATVIIYKNLFFSTPNSNVNINDLPPEIRAQMEASGINLSDL